MARAVGQFARFPIVVAGHEGRIEVQALGPSREVLASREVRLPVIPGGIVARVSYVDGEMRLEWEQLGDSRPVLVDVFQGSRWVRALSLDPSEPSLPPLGPGVWRLQARADLASDNTAGVAYAVVAGDGGPGVAELAAQTVVGDAARDGLDPLALAILDGLLPEASAHSAVRALFAVPSFDVVSVGAGMSSRVGVDAALERDQARRRWVAAIAILLIGVVVSLVLFRVEVMSQARARELLDGLGDSPSTLRSGASSGRGLWAFVLFVFVMIAVLALSKGWF